MLRNTFIKAIFVIVLVTGCSKEDNLSEPKTEQAIGEFLDDWTFKVFPANPYNNFDIAEFRLWVPEDSSTLKGILILSPSSQGNALGLAGSLEWQEFAKKEGLALCGVHLKGNYATAIGGSGQALIDAIQKIAMKNNIPEISTLPFLMRGYSAGGNFSYSFSNFKSERVVGLVSIRGGQLETTLKNAGIPGLILTGALEGDARNERLKGIALNKRGEGGLWSFAIEPDATHFSNLNDSDSLAKIFFSAILKKRISENTDQLKAIPEDSGWLGNNTRTNIYPFADYPGNKTSAFWLVDEEFATAWLAFQQ